MHAGLEVLCPSATSADPIFFTRNLTAIRAESRLVLAIRRTVAFGTATGLV
jgi:hypothetical protein